MAGVRSTSTYFRRTISSTKAPVGAADAAGLNASVRCFADAEAGDDIIHHDGTGVDAAGQLLAAGGIARPDAGGEPVFRVIGKLDGLFVGIERHDRQHGAKGFLAHDAHLVGDIGENTRGIEIRSQLRQADAACQPACSPGPRVFHMGFDDPQLALVNHGADVAVCLRAVANPQPFRLVGASLGKGFV